MLLAGKKTKRFSSVNHTTKTIHHHHHHHHHYHHQNQYKKPERASRASHETNWGNICFTDLKRKLTDTPFFEIHSMFYYFSCVCIGNKL